MFDNPFEPYLGTTQTLVETGRLRKGWRGYTRKPYPHRAWFKDGEQRVGVYLSEADCDLIKAAGYDLPMEAELDTPIPVQFMDSLQSQCSADCLRIQQVLAPDGTAHLPDVEQKELL